MEAAGFEALHAERVAALASLDDGVLAAMYVAMQVAPLRRLFSWAVPSAEALDAVEQASGGAVLDAGAGTGLWACALAARGVVVRAVDCAPLGGARHNGHHALRCGRSPPPFCAVEEAEASAAAAASPAHALLLVWPPPEAEGSSMAADAVRAYPGRCVLYAGEALLRGSQTAGPALATALAEGGYSLQRPALPLPRWPGTADCLYVFGRAECPGAPRATGLASTTTPATPFDTAAAAVARSELVAAQSAEWAAAASAHVARRVLRGGVRAAPGVEQAAVRAAAAAAPLARRLLLRALCL